MTVTKIEQTPHGYVNFKSKSETVQRAGGC